MRLTAALSIVLMLAGTARAEQAQERAAAPPRAPQAQPSAGATVDVDRLPLNLNRIRRELRHSVELEERDGLNLRYTIQIYGAGPQLELFSEDANLLNGPVPYGAPTHRELIDHVTPQPFRTPVADFSALIRWLADRDKDKKNQKGKR